MRSYSNDLRERVIKAVEDGLSRRAAARKLDVGAATAIRWAQQWKTTGSVAPAIHKPSRSPLEAHAAFLLGLIDQQPDMTLAEIKAALFSSVGVTAAVSAIHRFFARRQITFKKKLCTPPSKPGPTWLRPARPGKSPSLRLIRKSSSSSTRPAPRPT
jgi:transposase